MSPLRERLDAWWRDRGSAGSTVLYCLGTVPMLAMLWGLQAYALSSPQVLALYNAPRLQLVQSALVALMLWLVLLGGVAWRKHHGDTPPGPWLGHATVTPSLLMIVVLWISYGLLDTPMAMVLVEALVVARALFNFRVLVPGMVLGVLMVAASLVLQSHSVIKASPLLINPVFAGTSLAGWWKVWLAVVFHVSVVPFLVAMLMLFRSFARRRVELETLARTDMLTGLFNRREFMDRLEAESRRQARHDQVASVLMIDIDHFKRINDTHGHPAGDAVLERVGAMVRANLRQHVDVAARLGGEEFGVLLPDTDADQARSVALKLCDAMRQERFEHDGQAFQVTLSAGVAPIRRGQGEAALKEADALLYRAKAQGRDRVVNAT
jgi:diguanylate cyclase (GGDEF)-like protein